jgi:hypothetical protein
MMSILKGLVRSAGPLLTLGLVFATPPLAQEQAAFGGHGFLHNSAGAPIADAKVKLTGGAHGRSQHWCRRSLYASRATWRA